MRSAASFFDGEFVLLIFEEFITYSANWEGCWLYDLCLSLRVYSQSLRFLEAEFDLVYVVIDEIVEF